MQRSFIACLRTAYTLPAIPQEPPCGGVGIEYWDGELAGIFTRLCTLSDDQKRIEGLSGQVEVFRRHAVLSERAGHEQLRDELVAVADVLAGWRDELLADNGRMAA